MGSVVQTFIPQEGQIRVQYAYLFSPLSWLSDVRPVS